jgi:hypothetical protein
MASLLSFLSPQRIEETLPAGVIPQSVKSGSVVQFRSRSRYLPTSGTQYSIPGGSQIAQFRITGNDYLDMRTAQVHLRVDITSPVVGASGCIIQEGIYSVINRVRCALNSVIVQDTDQAHVSANVKVLNTMPKHLYETGDGQYLGLYKKATTGDIVPSYPPNLEEIYETISGFYTGDADVDSQNGSAFSIPLSLICPSLGAMETLLPLRNVGNFELTLFFESPANCFYNPADGSLGSASYTISDLTLEVDTLQLASPIVQLYDRLASDTSETGGVVLPVSVEVVQNINYGKGSGSKSVSISRGTTALTQVSIVKRTSPYVPAGDTSGVENTTQYLSTFASFGQSRAQFRLGARLYPQTASDSMARFYTETRHAFGMLNNMQGGGLHTRFSYENEVANQSSFTYAYNFRRVLTEALALDGENSIASGSIIQYDFSDDTSGLPAEVTNAVLTAIIESLRYIELKGSAVNVTGL